MRARAANSLMSGQGRQIETRREGTRRRCVTRIPPSSHDFSRQPGTMIEATLSAALLASALLPGSTHPAASDLDALFPPATKAMVVTSGPESEKFTYYDLVRQYAQATDQEVTMTEATESALRSLSVGLSRSFVPVEQVQHTFETLLAGAGFVVSLPKVAEVPIIGIWSKYGPERSALRGHDLPRSRPGRPGGEAPRGSLHRDDRAAEHRHPAAVELAANPARGCEHPAGAPRRNHGLDGARGPR